MHMVPILPILAIVVTSFLVVALFSAPAWMASQDRKRAAVLHGLLVPLFGLFFFSVVGSCQGSQHREHPAPLIVPLELRCQRYDLLVQHIAKRCHQAHARPIRASMRDQQPTAFGADGGPDIMSCQSLAHSPRLVQHAHLALCCYQPQKMHPTGRERQFARQHSDLLCRQLPSPGVRLRLSWCRSLQRWWMVALGIEPHELWRCPSHPSQVVEAMRAPEGLAPQPMQPLDDTVALGFADRQEDWFDADVQTQTHKGTKHPWHLVATVEGCVVVQLQSRGQSQPLPGRERVRAHGGTTLVGVQSLIERTCLHIHSVKDEQLGTACQVARSPVHRVQHVGRGRCRLREVAALGRTRMVNKIGIVQDTFDSCKRGDAPEQVSLAQFVLDGLRTAQADASLLQALPGRHNQLSDALGESSTLVQWRTGTRTQALPAQLVETVKPFGQPGRAAPNTRENSLTRMTL